MIDVTPGDFRKVHQPISAAQVNERAKVRHACDNAAAFITLLQLRQQALFGLLTPIAVCLPFRQDQAVAFLIHLNDF